MRPRPAPSEREPLPRDASGLPALDADAAEALVDGLRAMGLELTPPVLAAIDAHVRLLTAWGRHVNLTAIREPTLVVRLHVLDSLAAVRPVRERLGSVTSLVDIGSGGGYPGIPLALALGVRRLSLVDSVGRKARFLEVAGAATAAAMGDGAPRVEVLAERAETLAASARRATWDVATVRAVGSVAECAELGLPLVRVDGWLVCWKREATPGPGAGGGDLGSEVEAARALVTRLGGATPEVVPAGVPGAPAHRLVLIRKRGHTPVGFPRHPAARRGPRIPGERGPEGAPPRS